MRAAFGIACALLVLMLIKDHKRRMRAAVITARLIDRVR